MTSEFAMTTDLPKLAPRTADSHKGDFGRVLLVGGQTSGNTLANTAELWNVAGHSHTPVVGVVPRSGHAATLLGDGRVLLTGGTDANGRHMGLPETFNPSTNRVTPVTPGDALGNDNGVLAVTEAMPE